MPFPTVSYRTEGKTYSICGGCGRKGDLQFISVYEQVGEMYHFYYPECISPPHIMFTHIHTNQCWNPQHNMLHCVLSMIVWDMPRMTPTHPPCIATQVGLSPSHTAIVTVLAFPKLSCFSHSLCRYYCIIAIALGQPFLPSHLAPGSSPAAADIAHVTHDHKPCISYVALVWLGRSFTQKQKSEETEMDVPFISQICLEVHVAATDLQVNQLLKKKKIVFSAQGYFWPRMLFFECLSSSGGFFFLWTMDWFTERPPSPVW